LTVVPDVLHNDALTPEEFGSGKIDFQEWLGRHGPETVDPVAEIVIKNIREKFNVEKLAAIGYCFGAKVRTSTTEKLVACLCGCKVTYLLL